MFARLLSLAIRPIMVAGARAITHRQAYLAEPVLKRSLMTRNFRTTLNRYRFALYSTGPNEKIVQVPRSGDSITEGTIISWKKQVGDRVEVDEIIVDMETEKTTQEVRAPEAGVLAEIYAKAGEKVLVGSDLFKLQLGADAPKEKSAAKEKPAEENEKSSQDKSAVKEQTAERAKEKSSQDKTAVKQQSAEKEKEKEKTTQKEKEKPVENQETVEKQKSTTSGDRLERRVPMNRMRQRIAQRLKDSQNVNAMLTTFNDIDMSGIIDLRSQFREEFQKKHGVKLGFMSAFVRAATVALREQPVVNAVIDGSDIVYHDYVDVSVAVATPRGLVVPVIRNCENLSFAGIEKELHLLSEKARVDKLAIEDMIGGTFTISNGGVFGSLMGTPIINPPQSAILGMHATNKRPVVVNDQIVIRPMMYVALTYDHRLVDGREAVTFLKRIKELVEDPRRILLD